MEKKRVIKSLDKLEPSIKSLLFNTYPHGFESNLTRLTNTKNEPFYVVPLETENTAYLIKIVVSRNDEGEIEVDEEVFDTRNISLEKDDENPET